MPHLLPPEDENSPASPHAAEQPAAGYVAADVPDEQNPAGGPKNDGLPGTAHHQLAGQSAPQASAADAARLPVVEKGKATAPQGEDSADVKGRPADAASVTETDKGDADKPVRHPSIKAGDKAADKADGKAADK